MREKQGEVYNDHEREADRHHLQMREPKAQRHSATCLIPCALASTCMCSNQGMNHAVWTSGICKPVSIIIHWPLTLIFALQHLALASYRGVANSVAKPCARPSTALAPAQTIPVRDVGRQELELPTLKGARWGGPLGYVKRVWRGSQALLKCC